MFDSIVQFVRDTYKTKDFVPLHAPVFTGRERAYVLETIDSTFVSSVGAFVDRFERDMEAYTGSPKAVATVNGTAALHVALRLAGVQPGELVLTQALTFVATCNAIKYCSAEPIFIDVDRRTMGLSPSALETWLSENARVEADGVCRTNIDAKTIRACLPMHTFGHPCDLDGLVATCKKWNLALIEDAAESLGSIYKGRHTGTFGRLGTLSFNGNKIITTGGGGMVLSNEELGAKAKHLTTTAKVAHPYEFVHNEIGYNYRMPNLNAALGCAQLEQLELFIKAKRGLAERYANLLKGTELQFVSEPKECRSNYWLNAVVCQDIVQRDALIKHTNANGIMTRPIWKMMTTLDIYSDSRKGNLSNSEWLATRVVNLPSSVTGLERY